jgi:hypothetical protein
VFRTRGDGRAFWDNMRRRRSDEKGFSSHVIRKRVAECVCVERNKVVKSYEQVYRKGVIPMSVCLSEVQQFFHEGSSLVG